MPVFPGYPCSLGAHQAVVLSHAGPSSYTQVVVTVGTVPLVGGDSVQASEAGLKWIDFMAGAKTDDGSFLVIPVPIAPSGAPGQSTPTYRLQWIAQFTAAYGGQNQVVNTEAVALTNLSAQTVRLFALGL